MHYEDDVWQIERNELRALLECLGEGSRPLTSTLSFDLGTGAVWATDGRRALLCQTDLFAERPKKKKAAKKGTQKSARPNVFSISREVFDLAAAGRVERVEVAPLKESVTFIGPNYDASTRSVTLGSVDIRAVVLDRIPDMHTLVSDAQDVADSSSVPLDERNPTFNPKLLAPLVHLGDQFVLRVGPGREDAIVLTHESLDNRWTFIVMPMRT